MKRYHGVADELHQPRPAPPVRSGCARCPIVKSSEFVELGVQLGLATGP
jgi:hypothetical protein